MPKRQSRCRSLLVTPITKLELVAGLNVAGALKAMGAGIVLVREAGGFVTDLDGGNVTLSSAGILAGNEAIHRDLIAVLGDV